MILFCEDCGGKNDLTPSEFSGGRAVFRCARCGYANSYAVSLKETARPDTGAPPLFNAVKNYPEVVGAFVYHSQKGVVAAQMPSMLASEDIHALGRGLSEAYARGMEALTDIRVLTVVISDKHFFVTQAENRGYLVVVATTPELPSPLLKYLHL